MRLGCVVGAALAATAVSADRPYAPCTRVRPGADLQALVDRLAARREPAALCLTAGEFRLRRFLSIRHDGLVLRGEGPATLLRLDDGVQSPVVVVGDHRRRVPARPVSDVTVERLRIVGGGASGSEHHAAYPYLTNSALVVRTGRRITVRDVDVSACRSACILTEHDTRDVTIERSTVSAATWDGISFNRTAHARVVGNTITASTAAGITTEHLEDSVVEGNVIRDNRSHGVYLSDSRRNRFAGNRFVGNTNAGIFLTCAVRYRDPGPVLCWTDSMSQGNVFERNEFAGNRVDYVVAADVAANCAKPEAVANVSRGDAFEAAARVDQHPDRFGRCLVF